MMYRKEFNEIIASFQSIYPSPYELIANIIKTINSHQFFKNSELSIYSDVNINYYPIISKIQMDIHIIKAIE